jgi:tetratricopeptide (TPR) repeat protein
LVPWPGMPVTSPLDHSELRQIEKTLDEGNTQDAASRLGVLGDARDHKDAIDFLTTRLLFQRGRIDSDGAADRVSAILDRVDHFPEAEDWLSELEARTERSALGDAHGGRSGGTGEAVAGDEAADEAAFESSAEDGTTPSANPSGEASVTSLSPPSQAPSIPREPDPEHPFFDELGPDDDITPTEAAAAREQRDEPEDYRIDSSDPPPRATPADVPWSPDLLPSDPAPRPALGAARLPTEPPTRPDVAKLRRSFEPPTRPDLVRADVSVSAPHPSYKPFDSLRAKEQLSEQAGRYRGGVNDPGEVLGGPKRARPSFGARPSNRPQMDPERRIIEAFQLVRDGSLEEARRLVPEEGSTTTARPELRAMLGRVLLELGQAERATGEAAYALQHAPNSAEVQLVFVWSAVRYARQRDDAWSLERAGRILKDLPQNANVDAGLLDALGACVEVRVGVPTVALRLAQRALRTNADSVDGLAALAEASALCGEEQRAEAALERLHAVSEDAAEQLAPRLQRLGIGANGPASSASVWLPLEHTLSSGAREVALVGLETLAADAMSRLPWPWDDAQAAGRAASEFFTSAAVFRHFGAFDLSLHGIERLEAALELIYGVGPRAVDVDGASPALWQLAGVYLGETLRSCCEGSWGEPPDEVKDATVELLGGEIQPFQVVRRRILHGRHAPMKAALGEALSLAPPAAHAFRSSEVSQPELPWGDDHWPELEQLPRLGRAMGHSVVAAYAASEGYPRLDRGSGSLGAIDRYLELVAPGDAPLEADAPWTRWLCVFLGAYLGEVLCKEFGGGWALGERQEPESYLVELGSRHEAPLAVLLDVLTGRHPLSLADYVAQLRQTLGNP